MQHALDESAAQVTLSAATPFILTPISPVVGPASLHSYPVRGGFQSFVEFGADWFICNRSTLFRYNQQGELLQTWRAGLELPATPLTGLAVRRGIPQPELWIGTDGAGPLIWDTAAFRQFRPESAPARKTTALLPLPDGRILFGTLTAGLYVTDTRQCSLFREELKNAKITALAQGATTEEFWIGTRDQGVWLWRAGTLTHFTAELPDLEVLSIFGNEHGVWVGTVNGVAEFVNGQFKRRLLEGVLATALRQSGGRLWVSTVDQGVISVDLNQRLLPVAPARSLSADSNTFRALAFFDSQNGVIALGDAEIRHLPDGGSLLADSSAGLTNEHITALNIDSQRNLWVGYFNRGLDLISSSAAQRVRHLEDDTLFCVNRIKADPRANRMLVATANGLVFFDRSGQPRQTLRTKDGLISNHVTDVISMQTEKGTEETVIATNAGLTFMNGPTVSSVYAFQGLVNNHVYTVAQTNSTLLAGTLGGVSLLKNAVVQNSFTTANSNLTQNWITASSVVGDAIFLGTYGSGVVRVDSRYSVEGYREFSKKRVEINANAMLATPGAVYAGTAGQGLAFLPKGEQRWRFWTAGLPSTNVTALATDGGNLYIGTDNGLVRIAERDITL